jgi:hypothetical protein
MHVCISCASSDVTEYDAILDLRTGQSGEKGPVVSALGTLVVCSDCGMAHFTVSPSNLESLRASMAW